jgi:hypothetical protein
MGRTWGDCMTEKSIWHIVKDCAKGIGMPKLAPHDLRRTASPPFQCLLVAREWTIMPRLDA